MIPFCCVHCSRDCECFPAAQQPTKILPHWWGSRPKSNTWFLGSTWASQASKQRLNRFSAVLAQYISVNNTDTQTTLRVTSVAIGRLYAMHAPRPNVWISILPRGRNVLEAIDGTVRVDGRAWFESSVLTFHTPWPCNF